LPCKHPINRSINFGVKIVNGEVAGYNQGDNDPMSFVELDVANNSVYENEKSCNEMDTNILPPDIVKMGSGVEKDDRDPNSWSDNDF
jgi:hypothetical protein